MIRPVLVAVAVFGLAGTPVQTAAQTPTSAAQASVRAACMSSIRSLCSAEAISGDRSSVRACLIKNLDKTTPECQSAVKAAARSVRN